MKKFVISTLLVAGLSLGAALPAFADPGNSTNYPQNTNACVGNSSTTANTVYFPSDHDKLRSDQARQDDGQPGRADSVAVIPQCVAAGLSRGVAK